MQLLRKIYKSWRTLLLWWVVPAFTTYWISLLIAHWSDLNLWTAMESRSLNPALFFASPDDWLARKGVALVVCIITFGCFFRAGLNRAEEAWDS